ncbi:hypothetical protein C7445_105158 [Alicyclobacillus sacchari]|uniref:Four-helix bundle copper-binding protein n=1 Tax=Alicyclobacillus sacchari TaxID=392010 RepID=A0A4R8LNX4_9BACL|nr:hypothetical protein [Alicyclobacillus sacchari]TDY47977.1 hypothetical protein C7445_105158 [Alicyclobacillus sacchari]GMA56098.1 hypothetical protein GCM10025858_06010 [Alicyclobacillus sacchari]
MANEFPWMFDAEQGRSESPSHAAKHESYANLEPSSSSTSDSTTPIAPVPPFSYEDPDSSPMDVVFHASQVPPAASIPMGLEVPGGQYKVVEEKVEIEEIWFKPHPHHQCLNICEYVKDCMLHCERTLHMLMCQPDAPLRRRQLALLQDMIDVSLMTTRVIARKSPLMKSALLYCAKVCRICADECASYADPISVSAKQCCLRCADACEKFISGYTWM